MLPLAAVTAFTVSALSMVLLLPLLRRLGAMDAPNDRSSHTITTPRGGGLGLLLGLALGLLVDFASGNYAPTRWDIGLLAITMVLAGVGFVDDLRGVRATIRFGLQIACGLAMDLLIFQGSHRSLLELIGYGVIGIVWLAAYVNAFNFMDGINGISGVSCIVAGLWYAWVGDRYDDHPLSTWGLTLAAAALGFLLWNVPRAHVFLGDVGSYGVGAIIAFLAWWVAIRYKQPATALAPLAIYLADTAYTLWRRHRAGATLFEAHREHVYQRLAACGLSHTVATGVVALFTAGVCAAVRWLPSTAAIAASVVLILVYLGLPALDREYRGAGG